MKRKASKEKTDTCTDIPPGFIGEPFIIPADADGTLAFYHARIKPLLNFPQALIHIKNAPDIKHIIANCLLVPDAKVPDEELFNFLKESPIFLKARFTIEKVKRWQKEMYDKDTVKAFKAQDNLRKIGSTLALKRVERNRNEHIVYAVYSDVIKKVNGISRHKSHANRRLNLRKIYGGQVVDRLGDIFPSTDRKLAIRLTAQHLELTESTVETYIKRKKYEEISLGPIKAIVLKEKKTK